MRVAPIPRRTPDDERGAVAVFVAIVAVVLFAGAAYAVDAGNAWTTRRHVVTGVDAAALAAAGEYALGGNGCSDAAPDYLTANVDDAELERCVVNGAGTPQGNVTVRGYARSNFTFAGIVGIDDRDIAATTTAQWGIPLSASGMRPFAFCLEEGGELAAWLNRPFGPTGPSDVLYFEWTNTGGNGGGNGNRNGDDGDGAPCGPAPGNWGTLDFDGTAGGKNDTRDWTLDGYPGEIDIPSVVEQPQTGASAGVQQALDTLEASAAFVGWPIYSFREGPGNNTEYQVVAVAMGRVVDSDVRGNPGWIEIQFDRGVLSGRCCAPDGVLDTGARVVRICDVDTLAPDPQAC